MPWEELVNTYAPQFNPTTGVPVNPVRLVFSALLVKHRLGRGDKETVEQIRVQPCNHFSLGHAGYCNKTPFTPSIRAA